MAEDDKETFDARAAKIWLVLDSSGSISSQVVELCSGVNNFIDEQRSLMAECYINISTFDVRIIERYDGMIEGAPILNPGNYPLGGYTALCDAIGFTLEKVLADQSLKHLVVIFTDGGENASKKYQNYESLSALIARAANEGIDIVYLGAGKESIKAATAMQLPVASTLSVGTTGVSYTAALASASAGLMNIRTGVSKSYSFSEEDRKLQKAAGAV